MMIGSDDRSLLGECICGKFKLYSLSLQFLDWRAVAEAVVAVAAVPVVVIPVGVQQYHRPFLHNRWRQPWRTAEMPAFRPSLPVMRLSRISGDATIRIWSMEPG
jgi:hypothetical protein